MRITPVVVQVLLSLSEGAAHAYGIMKEIESRTDGRVRVGPGSLHFTLSKLEEVQWVEALAGRPEPTVDDARRKYFRITDAGSRVLKAELQLWADTVDQARAKALVPDPGSP